MSESIYNPCLFHRCEPFDIVRLQTDDILMLANNTFAGIKEEAIKTIKVMTK